MACEMLPRRCLPDGRVCGRELTSSSPPHGDDLQPVVIGTAQDRGWLPDHRLVQDQRHPEISSQAVCSESAQLASVNGASIRL